MRKRQPAGDLVGSEGLADYIIIVRGAVRVVRIVGNSEVWGRRAD
jgi:hypothetical protein